MNGSKPPTEAECAHMGRIKVMRCICCQLLGVEQESPTDVHHVRADREARNHWLVIPLCHDDCHQGTNGVHGRRIYLSILKITEWALLGFVIRDLHAAH